MKYDAATVAGRAKPRVRIPVPKLDRKTLSSLPATEDLLNAILPPREWKADGVAWIQHVSSTPATRIDVVNLQEQLDLRLQQRQARETGICPVREELYAQCFGEARGAGCEGGAAVAARRQHPPTTPPSAAPQTSSSVK